jgi:chromosome segregation protein
MYKKREIKGLAARKKYFEGEVANLVLARESHLSRIADADKELVSKKQTQRFCEIALVTAEKDLQSAFAESSRLQERLSLKGLEDEQLFEERELLNQEMIAAGVRKESSEEIKSGLEAEVALIQRNLAETRRDIDAVRGEVTTMKVRAAALKERQESTAAALKRVDQLQTELIARAARQNQEQQQGSDALERLRREAAATDEQLRQLMENHTEREALLVSLKSGYDGSLQRLKAEEQLLKELRGEDDRHRKTTAETSLKLSTLLMELENLEMQLKERFRLGLDEIAPVQMEKSFDDEQLSRRQLELQKQVDEFGEVNLTAIDEYQELEHRHTFLAEQKADLEESLQSLQQAIQRINRTTRKRFAETFEQVNEKFKDVFPRLFCGGKAELKLTNEDDLLETGLDIIVQPPGKKLQNVSLLSGGEKALTAVALIFSIFLIKPSPFCLLDEVDAPLDDANIGRFNEMIRDMSAFSQFILITHSKTTMAVADTLYGVTMEEPGVSKLVSVKLQ